MARQMKISEEVYQMLRILKINPSTSFNDVIKDLIENAIPVLPYELERIGELEMEDPGEVAYEYNELHETAVMEFWVEYYSQKKEREQEFLLEKHLQQKEREEEEAIDRYIEEQEQKKKIPASTPKKQKRTVKKELPEELKKNKAGEK